MDNQFDLAGLQILQHTATVGFTGVELNRPSLTLGAGASQLVFKALWLGDYPNGFEVRLVDPGNSSALALNYDAAGRRLLVVLAHDGVAVTSTAAQVAAAVNAITAPFGVGTVIRAATPTGGGSGVVVPATGVLAGGTPLTLGSTVRLTGANAGLFFFRQLGPVEFVSFEFALGASVPYVLSAVTYDNLAEVPAETVVLFSGTAQNRFQALENIVLSRGRALKFEAATTGVVRIGVRSPAPTFATSVRGAEITFDVVTRHMRAQRVDDLVDATVSYTLTLTAPPCIRMTNAAARAVVLFDPLAADSDLEWRIHDAARTADVAPITITAPAGVSLNGVVAGTLAMNTKGGAVLLRVTGPSAWETVGR
jgi:hypothetical protein